MLCYAKWVLRSSTFEAGCVSSRSSVSVAGTRCLIFCGPRDVWFPQWKWDEMMARVPDIEVSLKRCKAGQVPAIEPGLLRSLKRVP